MLYEELVGEVGRGAAKNPCEGSKDVERVANNENLESKVNRGCYHANFQGLEALNCAREVERKEREKSEVTKFVVEFP